MSGCGNCNGNCQSCNGCHGALVLNEGEVQMLQKLGQIPFLPVARRADSMDPVYLEDQDLSMEEYSLILLCLEKKGLISMDYDAPLKGFCDTAYADYPIRGSFALTAKGQQILDLLDIQGTEWDG